MSNFVNSCFEQKCQNVYFHISIGRAGERLNDRPHLWICHCCRNILCRDFPHLKQEQTPKSHILFIKIPKIKSRIQLTKSNSVLGDGILFFYQNLETLLPLYLPMYHSLTEKRISPHTLQNRKQPWNSSKHQGKIHTGFFKLKLLFFFGCGICSVSVLHLFCSVYFLSSWLTFL